MIIANLTKDSNRVACHGDYDLSFAREGSYFLVQGEKTIYNVLKTESLFLIKDFYVDSATSIHINSNSGMDLFLQDEILISFKEFCVDSIWGILNPGHGYKIGDVITLKGGISTQDTVTGMNKPAKLGVNKVSAKGEILEIGLRDAGQYIETPDKNANVYGGSGSGAQFEVEYKLIENRKTITRTIEHIDIVDDRTNILLNAPLPSKLKQGKLSIEKWAIYLSTPYLGESVNHVNVEIVKDFTPYYGFPLCLPNSFSRDIIFNQFALQVENKIKELESKLALLDNVPNNTANT